VRVVARRRGGLAHDVEIEGGHALVVDEPPEAGGAGAGPSPTAAARGMTDSGCSASTRTPAGAYAAVGPCYIRANQDRR